MNKKSILVLIVAIVLALLGAYFLGKYNSSQVASPTFKPSKAEIKNESELVDESLVTEKTYTMPTPYSTFEVKYPQFKNASAEFNKKIADLAIDGIKNQTGEAEDNWKERVATQSPGDNISQFPSASDKFDFSMTWKPIQVNANYISVLVTSSGYSGGAHGYENLNSFSYDVVRKKEVSLASLFSGNPNYLKTISDFSRTDLEKQFRKKLAIKTSDDETNFKDTVLPMMMDGTTPEIDNFAIFTFTPKEITLYFPEYQVAPYVMGDSSVEMPRK